MPDSEAKRKWAAENSKMFGFRVMKNTEADLWNLLHSVPVPSVVIKKGLRLYLEETKKEEKKRNERN